MINKEFYFIRGHKYLEDKDQTEELLEFMLNILKENKDIPMVKRILVDIHDIVFGESQFFISTAYPNVVKLRKIRNEIRKRFIDFFFKEHIEETLSFYNFYRGKTVFLFDYLPVVIRFLPTAKPSQRYFVELFLIMIDVLNSIEVKDDFDETIEAMALKGLKRYSVNENILLNLLNEKQQRKFEDMKVLPEDMKVLPYESFIDYLKTSLEEQIRLVKHNRFNVEIASMLIFNSYFPLLSTGIFGEFKPFEIEAVYGETLKNKDKIKEFIGNEVEKLGLGINKQLLVQNLEGVFEQISQELKREPLFSERQISLSRLDSLTFDSSQYKG
jgi:hypothetical protein